MDGSHSVHRSSPVIPEFSPHDPLPAGTGSRNEEQIHETNSKPPPAISSFEALIQVPQVLKRRFTA
jgi:hypothetical protein